jgi:hypothetical protein
MTSDQNLCPVHGNGYSDNCVCCGAAKHRNRAADSVTTPVKGVRNICFHEGCQYSAIREENKRLQERIEFLEAMAGKLRQQVGEVLKEMKL